MRLLESQSIGADRQQDGNWHTHWKELQQLIDRNVDSGWPPLNQTDMPAFPWRDVNEGAQRLRGWNVGVDLWQMNFSLTPGFACPPRRPMVQRGTVGVLPPGPPPSQQGGGEDGVLPRGSTGSRPTQRGLPLRRCPCPRVSPALAFALALRPRPRSREPAEQQGSREILDSETSPARALRRGQAEPSVSRHKGDPKVEK